MSTSGSKVVPVLVHQGYRAFADANVGYGLTRDGVALELCLGSGLSPDCMGDISGVQLLVNRAADGLACTMVSTAHDLISGDVVHIVGPKSLINHGTQCMVVALDSPQMWYNHLTSFHVHSQQAVCPALGEQSWLQWLLSGCSAGYCTASLWAGTGTGATYGQ